jgi:hypothetical protein
MIKNGFVFSLLILQLQASEQFLNSKEQIKCQLQKMVEVDQEIRFKIINSSTFPNIDESVRLELEKISKKNIKCLKQILNKYDWVTISEFDKEADHNAWLLVQHADNDIELQKSILTKLEKLYLSKETSSANYAYLYDRVAINEDKPQRYGTQGNIINGKWAAYPIEDQDNLDLRRKSVELSSFQEYLDAIKQNMKLN